MYCVDLDIIIASQEIEKLLSKVDKMFRIKEYPHSLNLNSDKSNLRIQIQTDSRYQEFIPNAEKKDVMGYLMKVASLKDVLKGKIWAYMDEERRKSKRQKDLADIYRIAESYPDLTGLLPAEIAKDMI